MEGMQEYGKKMREREVRDDGKREGCLKGRGDRYDIEKGA